MHGNNNSGGISFEISGSLTKFSNYILVLKTNQNRLHYLVVFLLILRLKYNLDMYIIEVELRQLPTITQILITNV